MRLFSKNRRPTNAQGAGRRAAKRRSTNRKNFLRLEGLESRLALASLPVAMNDFYSGLPDEPLEIGTPGILANDTADEGAPLAAALFSGPANGTLDLAEDGSFVYTPNAGFTGQDSFMYVANDGASDSQLAAVTLRIGNTAPEVGNDAFTMTEDGTLTLDAATGLLTNDSDLDGDALAASIVSQPLHGTVSLNEDGSFTYTPEANYNGLDGFSYQVSDGLENSAVASATITIDPANDSPVSVNDEYTTAEDTPLEIVAPGVLENDTDVDADALSSILVIPPMHGEVTLSADGGLIYTPAPDFTGVDGFSYLANDGSADSEAAAVTINVTPVADAPVGGADEYATSEDVPLVVDATGGVLANDADGDGDTLTAALVTGPANGVLTLNPDGSFSYTPNVNWSGSDSFVYQASDGTLTTEAVTVAINVAAANDAPTAAAEAYALDQGTTLTVDAAGGVLANDADIDGDALTAAVVTGPAHGTLSLSGDGSFTYTPEADYSGDDSFVYAASDGRETAEATVALTVREITQAPPPIEQNSRPLAVNDVFNVESGQTLEVPAVGVMANDSDPEASPLTASLFSGPMHGTVSLAEDGSFNYTPTAGYVGMDAFLYRVSDGDLWSALAAVTIHVNAAAETPDEIPTPTPEPEPAPEPEPCNPDPCCHVSENLISSIAAARHGHHWSGGQGAAESAIDAAMSRNWWQS
jgi:VCBS repeat-containing protein